MKKINLIEGLWTDSHEKQSVRGMRRYVAMIFAVLTLSMANIGTAWGATYTWTFDNSGNNSDVDLANKTTELSAYTSSGKSMSYVGGSSCKIGKKTAYLAMGGASIQSSSALSTRYFILTAPSANGTISVTFAGTASGNELIRTDNGDYQVIAAATSTTKVSSLLSGLTAGTTKIYIAFTAKCYISSIAWTDADAPEALTTLYSSDYKSSMESGASISVSSGMGEQTGGSGWVSAYSKYYKATSTNREATITFSPVLSLVSDGNDRGKIRIYYGSTDKSLNATVISDFKINGGSSIGTAYGVLEKEKVHVIEYTIPVGTSTLTTIYNKVAVSNGCLLHVEVLTHSAGGGCTSHSVNLSSSGSVTGGTFATSSATVCEEETATLTATPAAGYEFTSWAATGTGGHSLSSTTTNPATLTMGTADVTVGATFTKVYVPAGASYNFVNQGDGSVTWGSSHTVTLPAGTKTTVPAGSRVDNIFFSTALDIEYEKDAEAGTGYKGWKIKQSGKLAFYVENDCDVIVTNGIINGMKIHYYNQSNVETNTNLTSTAGTREETAHVKGGTLFEIVSTTTSTNTLKGIRVSSSCTAPNHVDITGTNKYLGGQTISLTATAYSSAGTGSPIDAGDITGYQWQKKIDGVWTNLSNGTVSEVTIAGATTNNLTISPCTHENSGGYRCVVSTGATCSTKSHADGTDGYGVHVFSIHGAYYGGEYSDHEIVWTSGTTGTATIHLNASSTYMFKVWSNAGYYYGNGSGNYIIQPINWDCGTGNQEMRLLTGPEGDYTFTVDIEHGLDGSPYVNLQVNYPSVTHPSTGYIYLSKWWDCYVHYWYNNDNVLSPWGSDPQISTYTNICGTDYWYFPVVDYYCNFIAKDNAGDPGNTTGDQYLGEGGSNGGKLMTHNGVSWGWQTFTFYTISFAGNGNTGGSMSDITGICSGADQALTANAFEKTGYTFNGWKDASSNDYADEATISNITANIALTAQWSAKSCTVTFDIEGGTGTISNVTATYGSAMPSKASNLPEKTGYTFGGFWDGDNGTGTKYYNANGTSAQNWDKNTTSTTTLYAKWTANTPTITLDNQDATNTPTGSVVATYGSAMPSIATLPTKTGYTFGGFYSDVAGGGTKYYNADGSSAKNSDLASAATLYALWTQTVTLHDNHGGSNNGSVSVTYKGTAGTPSAPTYAGHTPDLGYYAEAGCTNKVMALDGTLQTSVTDASSVVWTNSSSKWAHAGASILYAHWKCNTPTITDNGNNTVTITVPSGTTVRYTTDGTDPSSSTGTVYSTTFSIAADCTVKAIAYQSNCTDSEVASAECNYTAPANFQMVANSSAASDATLELDEYIAQGSKNCVTLTGGTAQYQGASGKTMKVNASNGSGTSQYYGWYFNSTGDKIVVTMTGHVLKVGSIISVEGYGASGNGITANTSTSLLNSTGSQQQWSASHTVVAGDTHLVGKNVITFDRYNSCRIFSITISNCQSGTMCVTPVLPSLTTPNRECTTGDFATWDATVTNAAAISAASGSQAVSYSWKNSSSVEVATTAAYTPTAAGTYTVTATVHSDEDGYIDASVTSSTLTASLYGNPSVTGPSDAEYVVGASASNLSVTATPTHGESLTYQWYSNTSKSTSSPTPTALENCTTSTYKPSTAAAATTYYFCKVSGGCEDVYSSIATVTVTEAPCLSAIITKSSGSYTVTSGTPKVITSDATITEGGTITLVNNYGSDKTYSFSDDGVGISTSSGYVEITFPSGFYTAVGSVIRVTGKGGGTGEGLSLIDDNGDVVASGTGSGAIDFTYTIIAASTIKNKNHIRINRAKTSGTNILKSVTVTGCDECTDFSPTLSYDKTTLWVNDGDIATPTLDKKTSTGSVTYSSSNTDIATVNESTGVVTAVAGGNVTITASIASDGTRCARTATCNLTIKHADCGWKEIAGVTLTANNAGTPSGTLIASTGGYGVLCEGSADANGGYKIGKGTYYIYLSLSSGNYFQNGDKVKVFVTQLSSTGDPMGVYVYAGSTTAGTQVAFKANGDMTANAEAVLELSNVPENTSSITIHRNSGVQNPYIKYMKVERFICTECLGFVDAEEDGDWSTTGNWVGSTGVSASVPTASDRVHIYKPVTVSGATAALASEIILYTNTPTNTGKLTIADDGVLKVAGTIQAYNNTTSTKATTVNDVVIECSKTSQGALIFDQPSSGSLQTKGTVNFYTRSYRDGTSKKLQWQYVGYPFISGTDEDYDGYYINKYSETQGKWIVMRDQGDRSIAAWEGLAIAGDGEGGAQLQGTFAPTTNQSITLSKTTGKGGGENLVGNSWTAPIQLADMSASDFGDATATVYIFNTGRFKNNGSEGAGTDTEGTTGHTVGQWMTIPISSAASGVWEGMKVIPAFQAFEVITSSATTLSLNYANHVRSASNTMNAELHAPARRGVKASEVDGYRIRVADSLTQTDMYLFEDMSFTTGFDNGWEGYYMPCDGRSAQLYAQTGLGKMAVAALPDLEGTLLGFKPGKSSEYTFSFGTNAGGYYLNDLKTQTSTLIEEGETYTFTWENGDSVNRFMISATPFAGMPSGLDESFDKTDKVQKVVYNDHVYIIRGGKIYGVDGTTVK